MSRYCSNITGKGRFVSDRSGFSFPRSELVVEPSTGLVVAKSESDGAFALGNHPQNKPPKWKAEKIGFQNPRPQNGHYADIYFIVDEDTSPLVDESGAALFFDDGEA